jgi:hypothetical protein
MRLVSKPPIKAKENKLLGEKLTHDPTLLDEEALLSAENLQTSWFREGLWDPQLPMKPP